MSAARPVPSSRVSLRGALATSLSLMCATIAGAASPDPLSAPRAEFLQAYAPLATAATVVPPRDSAALERYVLFPYLQAARLAQSLRLAGAAVPAALDEQIATFIRARESEPAAQDLRRGWLSSLAARGRWEEYLAFHRDAVDSAALRCHAFTARIELQRPAGLDAEVAKAWLTPRSLPECERAFAWLQGTGNLTDLLIEQRTRQALEGGNAGFARQIAARLSAARAAPLLQWAALLDNPRREIDALIASPGTAVETPALLAGWAKLTRTDRAAGKQRFDRLVSARQFDRRQASPFALALALPLSWDRDADALRYFARVEAGDFDDTSREWHVRSALWARDWQQASRSIAALSEEARRTARWRYWSARAAANQGEDATARQLYESILAEDNYYSAMAAARLNRRILPNPQPLVADAAQLARMEALPPFARSRELLLIGLDDAARAEWRFGFEQLMPSARAQAIHLAARWGWYNQAVATATGERVFNDYALLYPLPYDAEVARAAEVSGLPQHVIYGVVRQESLYQRNAVSSADARGLMQLLLETARRTARQWQQPAPTATTLFDPAVNTVLGAAHLKDLLNRFDGQLPLALAGYNAGPGAAQRWRPGEALDPDIWIENIPFNETRSYVQRILWHTLVFNWLRHPSPQDTREWLAPIRP